MAELEFSFTTTVDFSVPVSDHAFVLRCLPTTRDNQVVRGNVSLSPDVPYSIQHDSFGNTLIVGRIDEEHRSFTYHAEGSARVEDPSTSAVVNAGEAHPQFKFPSPLAKSNIDMEDYLDGTGLGYQRLGQDSVDVQLKYITRMCHVLHSDHLYEPGSTNVNTTAAESFAQGCGVCQDFAHIMIAMLRRLGVPARYASGFTVGEGATHAWVQAFVGGRWLGFDPTRGCVCDDTYLVCAVGRDWSDCPIERGVFIGNADQTQTVFMEVVKK